MNKPPTIMFQPINRIGLGHLSRLSAIALAVRAKAPEVYLPFLVAGDSHSFLESLGLPHVSFGVKLRETQGERWKREDQYELEYKIAKTILGKLQPQAIVFDLLVPTPILQAATEQRIPAALVIRKSKDMPKYFASLAPFEKHLKLFVFPHDPGEFNVPASIADRSHFVGRITRAGNAAPAEGRPAKRFIVITGGGGGYPTTVDFYNLVLEALACIRDAVSGFDIVLVTGPLFAEWSQLRLIDGVRLTPFEPDMISTLRAASLVICQGGYNTIAEVTRLGVPAICVPATRKFDDQFERAKNTAAASANFQNWGGGMDARGLSELIASSLASEAKPVPAAPADTGGAEAAADLILRLTLASPTAAASLT